MELWEINTGCTGQSYERSYVWCKNKEEAVKMFSKFHSDKDIDNIFLLLTENDPAFITVLSDSGFGKVLGSKK